MLSIPSSRSGDSSRGLFGLQKVPFQNITIKLSMTIYRNESILCKVKSLYKFCQKMRPVCSWFCRASCLLSKKHASDMRIECSRFKCVVTFTAWYRVYQWQNNFFFKQCICFQFGCKFWKLGAIFYIHLTFDLATRRYVQGFEWIFAKFLWHNTNKLYQWIVSSKMLLLYLGQTPKR